MRAAPLLLAVEGNERQKERSRRTYVIGQLRSLDSQLPHFAVVSLRLADGRRRGFLILILQLIQTPINTALTQQFLVGTDLAQVPFMHYQDSICLLDGT